MSEIKFTRKKQNDTGSSLLNNENYFLNPPLVIRLFNPIIIELNQKYIVLKYSNEDSTMLKETSDKIINSFKNCVLLDDNTFINPLCTQYIRCNLPIPWSPYKKKYYKYSFDFYTDNKKVNIDCNNIISMKKNDLVYNKMIIEVKNLWRMDNKYGFNCILKEIYTTKINNTVDGSSN